MEARGRSDNNLPSFEVRVSISLRKTCPLPVNYSELLAGKRGGGARRRPASQPAGPTVLFLDSSFTAKRRGTKGEKLRLCALYTRIHTHTHLYTHPFRVRERLSYRPGRVRVHANVWQVHSFHPRDPISLRGKGEKEKGGERERANPSEEEIQCKYGSAIGAKLSTSRVCRLFERCCCLRWPRARQGERRSEMGRRSGGTERRIFSVEALFLLLLLRYTVLSLFTNSTRRT